MTNRFTPGHRTTENTAKILDGSLATKSGILLQSRKIRSAGMRRPQQETSLFNPDGARKYLNAAERRRFQRVIENLPVRPRLFCEVLLWSGARVSEVLALTPLAVDLDSDVIALKTLKRRRPGTIRQIPLPRAIMRNLEIELDVRTLQADPTGATVRIWPWSRTTGWRLVKKMMSEAAVANPAASPRGLRHSFGVSAFQANVPPHLVQRWLGHASLRTTAIYADVSGKEERQFAARMWRRR